MASKEYFEQTATSIAVLNRNELKRRIKNSAEDLSWTLPRIISITSASTD